MKIYAMFSRSLSSAIPLFTLWLLTAVAPCGAQVIRGELSEERGGKHVAGTLVALLDATGAQRATALTDSLGRFDLRAPAPGIYRLRAERIGTRTTLSSPIHLTQGQIAQYHMTVPSEPVVLEGIVANLRGSRRCVSRPQNGAATAALWEEARKALNAARHTREQRARYDVLRYERELHPRTLRIQQERQETTSGTNVDPFVSLPPDQLHAGGYVQRDGKGFIFYAPDAAVLLSDEFLDTHCFRVSPGVGDLQGLIGLDFEPTRGRSRPDVRGTLWLDRKSMEVRHLAFGYTGLEFAGIEADGASTSAQGRVEFTRIPGGGWITNRWWIRMPALGQQTVRWGAATRQRQTVVGINESGGEVVQIALADGTVLRSGRGAALSGAVFDSIRLAPLTGARVLLDGTQWSTTSDDNGRFQFDQLPEASYGVRFSHARLDSLDYSPPPLDVHLAAGTTETVTLHVPSLLTIRASKCPDRSTARRSGTILGQVINQASGVPLADAQVEFTWTARTAEDPGRARVFTDASGWYLLCDVPIQQRLRAQARFLEAVGSSSEIILENENPAERNLQIRWYSSVGRQTDGTVIGASRQPVRVTGRVLDTQTSRPVEGVIVRLSGTQQQRTSNSAGFFAFAEVVPGTYVIQTHSPLHRPVRQQLAVGGGALEIELRITPAQ